MQDLAVARAVPVAPYTWGISVDLPGTAAETERVPVGMNQPFELIAIDAVIVRARVNTQLAAPTLADIMARIDCRHDTRLTTQARRGEVLPTGMAQQYVPLQSLLSGVRLFGIEFKEANEDLAFQFRWAVDVHANPVWDTARIMLSLLVRPIGAP